LLSRRLLRIVSTPEVFSVGVRKDFGARHDAQFTRAGEARRMTKLLTAALPALIALVVPASASALCEVEDPNDPNPPEDPICGGFTTGPAPPGGGGSGGGGSTGPLPVVVWASGYDVNPFDGAKGGIYISRLSGSARRRIVAFSSQNHDFEPHGLNLPDDHPSFSPDSRRIVFTSNRANSSNWDIYSMNVNGTGLVRLTSTAGLDTEPVFSPDGSKIAFATERYGGDLELAVMGANGSGVQRLTNNTLHDIEPAWRPDGQEIAFTRQFSSHEKDVFLMKPDGTEQRRITFADGEDHDPTYSPNGQELVITSERSPFSPPFGNVYKIRASDGEAIADLTSDLDFGAGDPFWSRSGTRIAFFKSLFPTLGPQQLWTMNASGGDKFHIPGEASVNVHPAIGLGLDDDQDGTPNYLESGSVGKARVSPHRIRAGRTSVLRFGWRHPRRWKRMETMHLRFSQGLRVRGIVRYDIEGNAFTLFNARHDAYGRSRKPGRNRLSSSLLTLDLGRTKVVAVSKKTIRLELAVRFRRRFAGERFRVRVQADDSSGRSQDEELRALRLR
jgi:WD40-like Beta Propeller Repeat